jgi:hypothetical protein
MKQAADSDENIHWHTSVASIKLVDRHIALIKHTLKQLGGCKDDRVGYDRTG